MSFEQAVNYTGAQPATSRRSCLHAPGTEMRYELEGSSIVPDWELVCENSVWRTVVQMIISLGKCLGACSVGIASDRFGRRKLFAFGAILYTLASLVTTFSPWYWLFLVGRFCLGSSSSGLFYPAVIMSGLRNEIWVGSNQVHCIMCKPPRPRSVRECGEPASRLDGCRLQSVVPDWHAVPGAGR